MHKSFPRTDGGMQRAIVIIPRMSTSCQECGCSCASCSSSNSLDLHHEIEELKSKLQDRNNAIRQMEHDATEIRQFSEYEMSKLQDEIVKLRDRYDRLYESHKKFQKINNDLEDNLLKIVNKFDSEKTSLQKEVASITSKLIDARVTMAELEEENERYRHDCNLAVQMLQCKPSNFVAQKLNSLPLALQERIRSNMSKEQLMSLDEVPPPVKIETKTIRVPMPTFPPTAMVYSLNKPTNEEQEKEDQEKSKQNTVPMTLVARVLKQPDQAKKTRKSYLCQKCHVDYVMIDKESQTCCAKEIEKEFIGRISPSLKVHKSLRSKLEIPTDT